MAFEMFKSKAGPLPMWGWGAILLGGALGYAVLKSRKQASSSADAAAAAPTEAPSDQVPDFITQTNVTVNNPADADTAAPEEGGATPPAGAKTTLPGSTAGHPKLTPPPKAPRSVPKPKAKALSYTVKHGDTLSSIAKRYGTSWQALWDYNTKTGVRPAATIKTLKSRGPNLLYAGETILIPQK